MLRVFYTIFNLYFVIIVIVKDSFALKNVQLTIIPKVVRRGHSVTLLCDYDTQEAPLYSVKWYRGFFEFYRYSPSELPTNKVFLYPGIDVNLEQSNSSQVVLQNVTFNLAGEFSCEVTTDAPSFSTIVVTDEMIVVEFPNHPPVITTNKDFYSVGDILKANCTSTSSWPPTLLSFSVNNQPITSSNSDARTNEIPTNLKAYRHNAVAEIPSNGTKTVMLSLLLLPMHFSVNGRGFKYVRITCRAWVESGAFEQTSNFDVMMGGQPTHEKVMLPNSAINAIVRPVAIFVIVFVSLST